MLSGAGVGEPVAVVSCVKTRSCRYQTVVLVLQSDFNDWGYNFLLPMFLLYSLDHLLSLSIGVVVALLSIANGRVVSSRRIAIGAFLVVLVFVMAALAVFVVLVTIIATSPSSGLTTTV